MARAWVEWGNNREGPDFRDASPSIITILRQQKLGATYAPCFCYSQNVFVCLDKLLIWLF